MSDKNKIELVSASLQSEGLINGMPYVHTKKVFVPKERIEELPALIGAVKPDSGESKSRATGKELVPSSNSLATISKAVYTKGMDLSMALAAFVHTQAGKLLPLSNGWVVRISTEFENEDGDQVEDYVAVTLASESEATEYAKKWMEEEAVKDPSILHKVLIYPEKHPPPHIAKYK